MKHALLAFLVAVQFSFSVFAESLTSYETIPSKWKTEIIKLPFDFAPQITLTGSEELVFAPGMYKAGTPDFFSYAFSWLIDSASVAPSSVFSSAHSENVDGLMSKEQVLENLYYYYEGLYKAVSKQESANITISMGQTAEPKWNYSGEIQWVEPFVTKQPQTLYFKAYSLNCGQQQRWYFKVSPQPKTHDVWQNFALVKEKSCK